MNEYNAGYRDGYHDASPDDAATCGIDGLKCFACEHYGDDE